MARGARSVLAVASRALLEACESLGREGDAILASAGLERADLASPDARIPATAADALWLACVARGAAPDLALQAARAVPDSAFRVLDYLAATGPTLGTGFSRVASYFHLVDPRGAIEVAPRGSDVALVFRSTIGIVLPREAQEFTLALLYLRLRAASASDWTPSEVAFAFPRPADVNAHERLFGVLPRFEADDAVLAIPRAIWDTPTKKADEALFALLDQHARLLSERTPEGSDFAQRARHAIEAGFVDGTATLSAVARRLGTSERSLQRRLEQEGLTFAEMADAARRTRAEALLRSPDVALVEIAFLLGFSEQSAFTRAFKRWTGRTPREARRLLLSPVRPASGQASKEATERGRH